MKTKQKKQPGVISAIGVLMTILFKLVGYMKDIYGKLPLMNFIERIGGDFYSLVTEERQDDLKIIAIIVTGTTRKAKEKVFATLLEAYKILGHRVFGPKELEMAGLKINQIPDLPFSCEQLKQAKRNDWDLMLYIDRLPNGSLLTGQSLNEFMGGKKADGTNLLFNISWYSKENFFAKETPGIKWKLVSKEILPNSKSKNYLKQTEFLAQYIQALYDDKNDAPNEIGEALNEFAILNNDGSFVAEVQSDNANVWKLAAAKLASLKLNQLFRESFIEAFYRMVMVEKISGDRLLENIYSWTKSRSSGGGLVRVGGCDADGAGVNGWGPDSAGGYLGVAFSAENF